MLTVNNAVSNAVSYYPSDTGVAQSEPMAEIHAGSTSELNAKLLKALIAQLNTSNKADKFDNIRATLNEYGLDTSGEDFNNGKLLAALERLKKANTSALPTDNVAAMLANQEQRAKITALALADAQHEIATNRTKANYAVSQLSAEKQRAVQELALDENSDDDGISVNTSYAELWARMALAIQQIKGDYVDFYADLMQKYTEMYEAYNTHVMGAASKAFSAGSDGNNLTFYVSVMIKGYDDFQKAVNAIDLGSVKNWDKMTAEERKSMVTTLEPAFKVSSSGKIEFNLDQYRAAPDFPSGIENQKVTTSNYQAWLASFNAGGSALQSNMQAFAQRYSQANSTFDNLNKVLSGAIASMAESAKDVLKALA